MIHAKCIEKLYMGKEIIGYKLQDDTGNILTVEPIKIKVALSRQLIDIVNLKLTTDGRIVDKVNKPAYMKCIGNTFKSDGQIETYILKSSTGSVISASPEEVSKRLQKNPNVITNVELDSYGIPYITQY